MCYLTIKKHPGWILMFVSLLFPHLSAHSADTEEVLPTITRETIRIPFTVERGKLILPVSIKESEPLKVILDTGMSYDGILLFKSKYIEAFGVSRSVEYGIGGAGGDGTSRAVTAEGITFSSGTAVFRDQLLIILTDENMEGFPTDGVTGYTLLGHYTLEIDQDRSEIRLHDPDTFELEGEWERLPLTFRENMIPWVNVTVEIEGSEPVILSCYIDSASGETIELLTRESNRFTLPSDLEPVYLGRGLSGDIHGHRGAVKAVRLGNLVVEKPEAVFAPAEIRSKQPGADGVIGNGLLKQFNIIFDYKNNVMYLKLVTVNPAR
jgi:hypothetical protein